MKYDLSEAQAYADEGKTKEWVTSFLTHSTGPNNDLARHMSEKAEIIENPIKYPLENSYVSAGPRKG